MRAYSVRHTFQDAAETTGDGDELNVAGLARLGIQVSYAAMASGSASPSASQSGSPSASASPSASQSKSPSASASPSASQSGSPSASQSVSPSASASPSGSASPSASPSPASGSSGTVYFECTVDGTNWFYLSATPSNGGTAVMWTDVPGLWLVTVSGLSLVRCRLAGTVTGAITVTGLGTVASA